MSYSFVTTNDFTPNNGGWTPIGNVTYTRKGNVFTLECESDSSIRLQLSVLSDTTFRVRFNPAPNFDYSVEVSPAVVNRNLGTVKLDTSKSTNDELIIDTGAIQIHVNLSPYQVTVYKGGQLVSQDTTGNNLIYIPGQEVIANFKNYPANARYCGFGEKAGSTLLKNNYTMTFFNFDNFEYSSGILPANEWGGPLNPTEPLYLSVPLLLEINPDPVGEGNTPGVPYTYGVFFDNTAQSYFNIGASDYSNMYGKYYFGALYGDLDYYFMYGDQVNNVLAQYTTLTGRPSMPPRYVFGFHQGGYGYYDSVKLSDVVNNYRQARIPIDGMHIDVDFQDNYRIFTHSEMKFPDVAQYLDSLRLLGIKCSTNISPMLTDNTLDEYGNITEYVQREALAAINGLIYNTDAGEGPQPDLFVGDVDYGFNYGTNPYPYPPLQPVDGATALGAAGNYPNLGLPEVRQKYGAQYYHLINEVGIDMIWQDMTDPAIDQSSTNPAKTFPLDLEVAVDAGGEVSYVPHAKVHNAYALYLVMATYEGLQKLKPEKRPFIIARGGYAGMQRYAALWTGDSASSWDFLQINLPVVLNVGLSGIPISGCDIGGFGNGSASTPTTNPPQVINGVVQGGITNYELLTRWMQLGAFLPWFRNHYSLYSKQFQEPYAYGEPVPTNCRKYVELRYRLMQLFYDAMYQNTQTGLPIARAMFINDGHDVEVYNHLDDQFFLGADFLIAPIVTQHETLPEPTAPIRSIYLPSGSNWYSFMDNMYPLQAPVPGGTTINNYYADLSLVPIYVREGAIIPTIQLEQYVGQLAENPITINIYPGKDNSYQLYLDDGVSTDAEKNNAYRLVEIDHVSFNNGKQVIFNRTVDNYEPASKFYFVAILGMVTTPSAVSVDKQPLPNVNTPQNLEASPVNSYYWNSSIQITFVKVFDNAKTFEISILY